MGDYPDIFKQLARRLLFALPLFILGGSGKIIARYAGDGAMLPGFAAGLLSTACILLGAIIVATPLARMIAEPFGSLFFSNTRYDKPQPRFSIPAARRREGKFEEAIQGYAQLVEDHPDAAVRAYIEMLDVLIVDLRDADRADGLYLEAIEKLSAKGDREHLAKIYRDIRSRIQSDRHGLPERAPIQLHPRR